MELNQYTMAICAVTIALSAIVATIEGVRGLGPGSVHRTTRDNP